MPSGYGGVDGAWGPGGGFGDEALEKGAGGWADVVAAFGVPLDSEDEVVRGGIAAVSAGLAAFYGFNNSVLRAASGYAEVVAGDADGLVVAGVDGEAEETVLFRRFDGGNDGSEEGVGGYGSSVGYGYGASGGVVDWHGDQVLDESSAAPDVEGLGAETDGEDRLIEVVGVLDEEFVYIFTGRVGGAALGEWVLAVFLRVYISRATGEQDGMAGVDEVGGLAGSGVERDFDGFAAGAGDSFGVLGPGLAVVFEVSAGGDGDGYAGFHAGYHDTAWAEKGRLSTDFHRLNR